MTQQRSVHSVIAKGLKKRRAFDATSIGARNSRLCLFATRSHVRIGPSLHFNRILISSTDEALNTHIRQVMGLGLIETEHFFGRFYRSMSLTLAVVAGYQWFEHGGGPDHVADLPGFAGVSVGGGIGRHRESLLQQLADGNVLIVPADT